jgi:site-specific DNA-adenine methylase
MKIIMNPPYKGGLHLEILEHIIKVFPDAEIVNLSPVTWMQDILAELKQGTEYKRHKNILRWISSLDVIPVSYANRFFKINSRSDLGTYKLTKKGGFDVEGFRFDTPEKRLAYKLATEVFPKCDRFTKSMDFSKEIKFIFPATAGNTGKSDWGQLCSKDKEVAYSFSESESKYFKISFDTELERNNFFNSLFTKFYQFFVATSRRSIDTPPILPFIPHFFNVSWEGKSGIISGYKNPITDEMLYEYFGLTEIEIRTVDDFFEDINK